MDESLKPEAKQLLRNFEDGGGRPRHEERRRRYLKANGPEKMRIIAEAI